MKCDKCKHTGREMTIQVGNTKICQECVNDAATKNNANAYVVNELLTYVDTYRHQSSKAKIQLACLKFYADQDIIDAKYALYSEFSDIHRLGWTPATEQKQRSLLKTYTVLYKHLMNVMKHLTL